LRALAEASDHPLCRGLLPDLQDVSDRVSSVYGFLALAFSCLSAPVAVRGQYPSSGVIVTTPVSHPSVVYSTPGQPVRFSSGATLRTELLPVTKTAIAYPPVPVPEPVTTVTTNTASLSGASSVTEDWDLAATDWQGQRLQATLARAAAGLDQERLPQIEQAKTELKAALVQVESYVGVGTTNGDRWLRFMRVNEIRAELEKERPQPAKFAELEMHMRQNYMGLENAPMTRLRAALHNMELASKYGQSPTRTIESLERAIQTAAEALNTAGPAGANSERYQSIGRVLNLLVETKQVPGTVADLRSSFSSSNFQVTVHESGINRLISRAVAEPSPVNECILGTRVLGRACLTGSVSADLFPVQSGIGVRVNLTGEITSRNRGFNRGVVLGTSSRSPVFLSKPVIVNQYGINASPSSVSTRLQSSINSIQHRLRIVRRIAKRKAAEQKPQADAIAEARMQNKVQRQYDEQVEEQLTQARGKLSEIRQQAQNRPEFERLDFPKPVVSYASSDATVDLNAVQAASFQLAATQSSPIPKPMDALAVVDLHQSAVINAMETLLGDRTIHQHDLDDLARQILGKVPEELLNGEPQDPFTVTMLGFNPVQVEFDQDQVKISLRFSRIDGNDRKIPGAIVTVKYGVSLSGNRLYLTRQGDLEIELPRVRSRIQATS
ncbi:MAG: hypothetical protein AAGG44_19835, partial [Planctomycetota bacterium]